MYRALGQFDKAVENFRKASEANPRHLQSLFNLGVVYAYDLKQPKKAIEAWEKVVAADPSSAQAIQAHTAPAGEDRAVAGGDRNASRAVRAPHRA